MDNWTLNLDLARKAVRAQKESGNENIETWAEKLSKEMFGKEDTNRYDVRCPECGGLNSEGQGGNENCFHCGSCMFTECASDFDPKGFLKPGETKITDSLKKMI